MCIYSKYHRISITYLGDPHKHQTTLGVLISSRFLRFKIHTIPKQSLPPIFWVEALNTAFHLINILLTTTLHYKTPHDLLVHELFTYDHVRVFRCLYYPNLIATTSHKLARSHSTPCIFIGYPLNKKGYRRLRSPFPFVTSDESTVPLHHSLSRVSSQHFHIPLQPSLQSQKCYPIFLSPGPVLH